MVCKTLKISLIFAQFCWHFEDALKFKYLSEMASISDPFIWESPPSAREISQPLWCWWLLTVVKMLPVYLSISGSFRKCQVRNINASACHRWQARKINACNSEFIDFNNYFHAFSTYSCAHLCRSHTVVIRLYSII